MIEDRPADQLDGLGYDGVPEASQAVHVVGKPIIHSTNEGLGLARCDREISRSRPLIPKASPKSLDPSMLAVSQVLPARSFQLKFELPSVTVGVGNKPQPIPSVGGTKGGSR